MSVFKRILFFTLITGLPVSQVFAEPDPNFHIYLLFGQSNMAGGCNGSTAKPSSIDNKPADCDTTPRVKVLAFTNCNSTSTPCKTKLNRQHNSWYTAFPPYHNCGEGIGPADYFGKMLLDSIRDDIKIGFIPCALSGVDIDFFRKGIKSSRRSEFTIPPDNHWNSAYDWMLERCKLAQQSGVIKGILLHQGESDAGTGDTWVSKVKGIFSDLKTDLKLGDIPIVVGELIQDPAADQGVKALNPYVNKLPSQVTNCAVASSKDLKLRSEDTYRLHFSCESVREFGRRYARAFLQLADANLVPRKGSVQVVSPRTVTPQKVINLSAGQVSIYSLDGHFINTLNNITTENALRTIKAKGVYIVSRKLENGEKAVVPFVKN
jgi:hypothetical protein